MTTSKIEWTDRSDWNPIRGCTRVSPGCGGPGRHGGCYAEGMAARFSDPGQWGHGFAEMRNHEPRWTGKVELQEDRVALPLSWRKPARVFVSSTSDVFHEALLDGTIDKLFAVMAMCPHLTFQVLTKRPERMREYCSASHRLNHINGAIWSQLGSPKGSKIKHGGNWATKVLPLSNVWLGTSVEDQVRADERRPAMAALAADGWTTFVSYEPALGSVDWLGWQFLKWLVSGGESGPHARPSHVHWHRRARDWCASHDIPYFFKQWGAWWDAASGGPAELYDMVHEDDRLMRVGKKDAGRLLDGVYHDAMPMRP